MGKRMAGKKTTKKRAKVAVPSTKTRDKGKVLIQTVLEPEDAEWIREQARKDQLSMAAWLRVHFHRLRLSKPVGGVPMRKVGGLILPEVEYHEGFRRHETADDATLTCPCGSSFTWSGLDDRLEGWVSAHKPHQKGAAS
jgi:hypothetical protein